MNTVFAEEFLDRVLSIMDQKHHWAWGHFSGAQVSKEQLKIHFQQEYGVYVRDFPVFLSRIHGKNPPAPIRKMLAENIYEEDTGGLSLGLSHPELFLKMMTGLGYAPDDFQEVRLLPGSRQYRRWLDEVSIKRDWLVGVAVMTVFVEGSLHDRRECTHPSSAKTNEEIEAIIAQHPLVRYHGIALECMDLTRAHQRVEAGHRQSAYQALLSYTTTAQTQQTILSYLSRTLDYWLRHRDGVARACGLQTAASTHAS